MLQKQTKLLRGIAACAGTYSALAFGVIGWPASGYAAAVMGGAWFLRKGKQQLWSHGTARWANVATDLKRSGMLDAKSGLILGRVGKNIVRLPQAVHTSIFAPTGVGKGVSCIMPFLLTCEESCVVVDFKGELFAETAEFRSRVLGHRIVRLAPYGETSDTFNPLDFIDRNSPHAIDDCNDLADALVVRTGEEKEPHWNDSAQINLGAVAATVVGHGDGSMRSLNMVRDILSNPQALENTIKLMTESDWLGGALKPLGGQMMHYKGEEKSSTLTTSLRHLKFLGTPAIAKNVSKSTFDPAQLRKGKVTVYLCIPPDRADAMKGLLRMWVGSLLRACLRQGLSRPGLGKVHFIMDEAALALDGGMGCVTSALNIGRGSDIRFQFYFQSAGQLLKCFPQGQGQTLRANTTQIYFGVNDNETAEEVSKRLGDWTAIVEEGGSSTSWQKSYSGSTRDSDGRGFSQSGGSNQSWKQIARRLLQPSEIMALNPRAAITLVAGMPPIQTWLLRYYEEKWLKQRSRLREWLSDWAKFSRALVACVFLVYVAAFVTPAAIRCLHLWMGR
jgi:type IV secretion system protein VirD4